jgi:hypothetical protein
MASATALDDSVMTYVSSVDDSTAPDPDTVPSTATDTNAGDSPRGRGLLSNTLDLGAGPRLATDPGTGRGGGGGGLGDTGLLSTLEDASFFNDLRLLDLNRVGVDDELGGSGEFEDGMAEGNTSVG